MGILDVLFPKRCVSCKKVGEYLCPECFAKVSFDVHSLCLSCGKPSFDGLTHPVCKTRLSIDGAFCAIAYKQTAKRLLYVLKYQPYVFAITDFLAGLMYESLIQQESFVRILETERPVLVPIPLSGKKQRKRGYNQAALLAKSIGKLLNVEVVDCLDRIKETNPQFGLNREERQKNMKDAFSFSSKKKMVNYKSALLVDDILTTGTTLSEAAQVLKKNGFQRVWGLCLARDA